MNTKSKKIVKRLKHVMNELERYPFQYWTEYNASLLEVVEDLENLLTEFRVDREQTITMPDNMTVKEIRITSKDDLQKLLEHFNVRCFKEFTAQVEVEKPEPQGGGVGMRSELGSLWGRFLKANMDVESIREEIEAVIKQSGLSA